MPTTERTDVEWKEIYTFEKCQCKATWVGTDDFFFCQWEAETPEDILTTLTERGFDDYIFTALYPILMHCPSSYKLGHKVGLSYGGSGSSVGLIMQPAFDVASGVVGLSVF